MKVHFSGKGFKTQLLITISLFALALLFSFFHYHTAPGFNEKNCLLCAFSVSIKTAALLFLVFFVVTIGRLKFFAVLFESFPSRFYRAGSLRAPPSMIF